MIAAGSQLIYEPAAIVAHRHHSEPAALLRQAYGYGVGLSAHLTRCALKDPASMFAMLRRAPRGVRRAVVIARPDGERSTTNGTDPTELPSVTLASVRGILAGPVRYSRSRMNGRPYIARRGNRAELGLHEPLEMAS